MPLRFLPLRPALFCFTLAALPVFAQGTAPQKPSDLQSLSKDVHQLQAQQQAILDRLDELKKLLRPANQPPDVTPPAHMSMRGEAFRGDPKATLAIVEYGDFECPFCRRFQHDAYPQIAAGYVQTGKVRYYYRDMPLPFHEHAMPAARAARCAGEQGKYWEMYDALFADPVLPGTFDETAKPLSLDVARLDACTANPVSTVPIQHTVEEAGKMNISGTPTFLIGTLDDHGDLKVEKTIVGAQPFGAFQTVLDGLAAQQHNSAAAMTTEKHF